MCNTKEKRSCVTVRENVWFLLVVFFVLAVLAWTHFSVTRLQAVEGVGSLSVLENGETYAFWTVRLPSWIGTTIIGISGLLLLFRIVRRRLPKMALLFLFSHVVLLVLFHFVMLYYDFGAFN